MSAPLAFVAVLATVIQVAHDGSWVADGIRWTTEWRADADEGWVPLAAPLPADAEVTCPGAVAERDERGRIIGFTPRIPDTGGRFEVTLAQPLDADTLAVPVLAGPAVQRVTVEGIDFRPAPELGFDKHTRYWAPTALAGRERARFERDWRRRGGQRARPWDQAVYFRADPTLARGLPGRSTPEGSVSVAVQALLALVLVALLGFATLLYRSLESQARSERNASYIRRHFGEEP